MPECIICHDIVDASDLIPHAEVCKACDAKLTKQNEMGRCGWCGMPVLECICDDLFGEIV